MARERANRPPRPKRSLVSRLGFIAGGILLTAAGAGLVLGGGTQARLFRVAGILIVVGIALVVVGIIG